MKRNILSIVVAIVAAVITFTIIEQLIHFVYPFPQGMDPGNMEQINEYLRELPNLYWGLVIVGWVIGSALAGFLIKKISRSTSMILPLIVGVVLTLAGIANILAFQHPAWFVVCTLLVFIPSVLAGNYYSQLNS